MGNAMVARELRSLYIQHMVFEVLNMRIFALFLFTFGRRMVELTLFSRLCQQTFVRNLKD